MTAKQEYINFVKSYEGYIPLFLLPKWLDIVSEGRNWDVALVKNKEIVGIWPYIVYKKYHLKFMLQPILSPFLGPHLFYPINQTKTESKLAFEKKVISKLIDQIPKNLRILKVKTNPSLTNWLPFYWRGFKQSTHYTYQLDIANISDLKSGYTSSLRSELKNLPQNVSILESEDAEQVYQLAVSSYNKQDSEIYFSKEVFLNVDQLLKSEGNRSIYVAKRDSGEVIACVYVLYDNSTAFLPIIGRGNISSEESAITKALIHYSIINSHKKGYTVYDFEGSMFPQFEKVFRSFGSHQVPYHVLSRLNSKLLDLVLS